VTSITSVLRAPLWKSVEDRSKVAGGAAGGTAVGATGARLEDAPEANRRQESVISDWSRNGRSPFDCERATDSSPRTVRQMAPRLSLKRLTRRVSDGTCSAAPSYRFKDWRVRAQWSWPIGG